jgi:hypothetical protein
LAQPCQIAPSQRFATGVENPSLLWINVTFKEKILRGVIALPARRRLNCFRGFSQNPILQCTLLGDFLLISKHEKFSAILPVDFPFAQM